MKKYTIEYNFIGRVKSKTAESISQLSEWLKEAMNDKLLKAGSIVIWTEEKK